MAAESITEGVVEEVITVTTRRINGTVISSFGIGLGIGVAVGFYIGYRYSKKKLRADIFEEAEKEIREVREHYRQKTIAVEAKEKPSVTDLVREKGYSDQEVVDDHPERLLHPPVPVEPPRRSYHQAPQVGVPESHPRFDPSDLRTDSASKDKNEDWDWDKELAHRDEVEPYIIHQDEFEGSTEGYQQTSYLYFSGDNVLVDIDEPQTILINTGNLIGFEALSRFGHGSDDYNVVYVRNTELELEFEIFRTKGSWEEEVRGLNPNEPS